MLIELIRNGSNYSVREVVLMIIVMLFALTISFSFHEFMHAVVAYWLGDDTPRLYGRVTMNPKAHLDTMGTVLLLLVGCVPLDRLYDAVDDAGRRNDQHSCCRRRIKEALD